MNKIIFWNREYEKEARCFYERNRMTMNEYMTRLRTEEKCITYQDLTNENLPTPSIFSNMNIYRSGNDIALLIYIKPKFDRMFFTRLVFGSLPNNTRLVSYKNSVYGISKKFFEYYRWDDYLNIIENGNNNYSRMETVIEAEKDKSLNYVLQYCMNAVLPDTRNKSELIIYFTNHNERIHDINIIGGMVIMCYETIIPVIPLIVDKIVNFASDEYEVHIMPFVDFSFSHMLGLFDMLDVDFGNNYSCWVRFHKCNDISGAKYPVYEFMLGKNILEYAGSYIMDERINVQKMSGTYFVYLSYETCMNIDAEHFGKYMWLFDCITRKPRNANVILNVDRTQYKELIYYFELSPINRKYIPFAVLEHD